MTLKHVFSSMLLITYVSVTYACDGCLILHEESFKNIAPRFKVTYLKFDKMHEARDVYGIFDRLSLEQQNVQDLLFAGVYVRHYHDNTNEAFALKYNVTKNDYPAYFIFKQGSEDPIQYPKEVPLTLSNLRRFLTNNSDLVLDPVGPLEPLELIANKFVLSEEKEALLEEAKILVEALPDANQESGKLFLSLMEEIIKNGYDFIPPETDEILMEMIQGSDRMEELEARLVVFGSFTIPKDKIEYKPMFF